MNVCGRLIALKERGGSLTHLPAPHTASPVPVRSLWEHTGEQSNSTLTNKIEDTDKAELDDVFQVSRTAIPALPFSTSCLVFVF